LQLVGRYMSVPGVVLVTPESTCTVVMLASAEDMFEVRPIFV
jgi:hypothetical protein